MNLRPAKFVDLTFISFLFASCEKDTYSSPPAYEKATDILLAVSDYWVKYKKHPKTTAEIISAIREFSPSAETDPWSTPYKVEFSEPFLYTIISAGPDRKFNTSDDMILEKKMSPSKGRKR